MSVQNLSTEQTEKIQAAGRNLLLYIFSMLKTGEIHDLNNEAWLRPSEKIGDVIRELFKYERRRVTFILHEGTAQVNAHALWLDKSTLETTQELEQMLALREIGGVIFRDVPKEDSLKEFFYEVARFKAAESEAEPFQALTDNLVKRGVSTIAAAPRPNRLDQVGVGVRGVRSVWTYGKCVAGFQDVLERQPIEVKSARRLAQELVDTCSQEQDLLVALALSGGERSRSRLAVDTAVICAAVGRGMGMSRQACGDLAMAGLLSEIGAAYLSERGTSVDQSFAVSTLTFRQLAEGSALTAAFLHRVGIACEWSGHERADGYRVDGAPSPLPMSVLIRTIRTLLETVHGVVKAPQTVLQSVTEMLNESHSVADRRAVNVVATVIGFLPVGSIVRLQNGDIAVVSEIDHIRGIRAFSSPELPAGKQRKIYVRRMLTESGKTISERDARVCIGEAAPSAGEWTVHSLISNLGLEEVALRGIFPNPSVVRTQVGVM